MAKDALELHLYGMEEDKDKNTPSPSKPEEISINSGAFVTLIEAYMPLIREEMARQGY